MTVAINPSDIALKAVCGPFGIGDVANLHFARSDASVVHHGAGEEVAGEGDPAENCFMVVKGVFRVVKVTRDGRGQIFAFYAGDMCGLEPGSSYDITIEAVSAGSIAALSRTSCRTGWFAIFDGATRALALSIDHMTMVGRSSAEERPAWFLTMLRDRAAIPGGEPVTVELAMQRQDIADYLGLTIETVSRTFTALKAHGVIALPTTRRVEILKSKALDRLAAADRDAPAWDQRLCA
jgi:CRP-like cAMP-binding protein